MLQAVTDRRVSINAVNIDGMCFNNATSNDIENSKS